MIKSTAEDVMKELKRDYVKGPKDAHMEAEMMRRFNSFPPEKKKAIISAIHLLGLPSDPASIIEVGLRMHRLGLIDLEVDE